MMFNETAVIHNQVIKLYVDHQLTTLVFVGLGLTVNKIYNTKYKRMRSQTASMDNNILYFITSNFFET